MRFVRGQLVRYVVAYSARNIPLVGQVFEVVLVGPIRAGTIQGKYGFVTDNADYILDYARTKDEHHRQWLPADDYQLQPVDPPAEPISLTRQLTTEEPA